MMNVQSDMNEPPPEYDALLKPTANTQIRHHQPIVHYHAAQQPIVLNQIPHAPQPIPVNVIVNTGGNMNGNSVGVGSKNGMLICSYCRSGLMKPRRSLLMKFAVSLIAIIIFILGLLPCYWDWISWSFTHILIIVSVVIILTIILCFMPFIYKKQCTTCKQIM